MEISQEWLKDYIWLIAILALWELAWKGLALWKAARAGSRGWFVGLLLINSLGLMPIIYIFMISEKPKK